MFVSPPVSAQTVAEREGDGEAVAVERQIRLIEQALEQAVGRGVSTVEQQFSTFVPGLRFFAGSIQARGFALDGYGLFFDVEYPVVRRSILWSMGALNQFVDANMASALANLRRQMLAMQDGPGRSAFSEALRELEGQVRSTRERSVSLGGSDRIADRRVDESPTPDAVELYRTTLTQALTDVLINYGGALPAGALGDEQWLTVAARDGRGLRSGGGEPRTLLLRVRGRDLSAFRDGRLPVAAVRARVETR